MKVVHRPQTGFAIIEALIAMTVTVLGILGMTNMEMFLARNADVAAQRTEATQVAQECLETMRSFTSLAVWNGLTPSNTTCPAVPDGRNATYNRTVALGGMVSDAMRPVTVTVSWVDRAGVTQQVALASVISKTDPADSGMLRFPLPQNTILKRPKNRSLDIPIPAIDNGDGTSSIDLRTGYTIKFSNDSGTVVEACTPTCTPMRGYIVAGYLSRDSSVSNTEWAAVEGSLGINYSDLTLNNPAAAITCQFGNSGTANVKYYMCVVPLNPNYLWSGTLRIGGPPALRSGNFFLCRYQYEATSTVLDPNQRNVQPYADVNRSIDQQNYLLASGAASASCPAAMSVAGVSVGVLHQDCRSSNANRATDCPAVSP